METRANFVLIGAFTILSIIIAAISALWIANAGLDKQFSTYDVVFQGPVRGVDMGGEVRFNGIKVGEVTRLTLDKKNPLLVVARIRVISDTPVKTDSLAQLEPAGLTGLAYIQILAGSPGAGPLVRLKGQEKPTIMARRSQIDRLFQGGEGVLSTTLEALERVNRLLNDENLGALGATFSNLNKASNKVARDGELVDTATAAAASIRDAGQQIAQLSTVVSGLSQNAAATSNTYNQLGLNLIEQTKGFSERSNALMETSSAVVADTGRLARTANSTAAEFELSARSLRAATEDLRKVAVNFDAASVATQRFFAQGSNETLPDISSAAAGINGAAQSIDILVQEAGNSPTGLLSRAPAQTVKWKR